MTIELGPELASLVTSMAQKQGKTPEGLALADVQLVALRPLGGVRSRDRGCGPRRRLSWATSHGSGLT